VALTLSVWPQEEHPAGVIGAGMVVFLARGANDLYNTADATALPHRLLLH